MKNGVKRWVDPLAMFLMVIVLWMAVSRLQDTAWTDHLIRVKFLVMIACPLGFMLGASRFGKRTVVFFSLVYTAYFIPWQLALMMEPDISWSERLLSVWGRMTFNLSLFLSNRPVQDSILFVVIMMVLFWSLSLLACYQLVRHGQSWMPLFVVGVAYFTIDYYHPSLPRREFYSGLFVLMVLLLVSRVYFLARREEWHELGVAMDVDTGQSLGWSMVVGGALLVLLAWNTPTILETMVSGSPAQKRLLESLSSVRNRFSNLFAGLRSPVVYISDLYGENLSLGTGARLGDEPIFTARVQGSRRTGVRFYWRGRSYDTYENGKWSSSMITRKSVRPSDWPLGYATLEGRLRVGIDYTVHSSIVRLMYVPSLPFSFSRPGQVLGQEVHEIINGEPFDDYDVLAVVTDQPLHSGDLLKAEAWISAPTIKQLRAAGENYPFYVLTTYLQVPSDLSPRIRNLALELTQGEETAYDKTMAITEYLRRNIEYVETVPPPPAGRDPLEWFLFDYKKGFCNYYASAEVVMLRAAGVPARLAAGFAQGAYDEVSKSYEVKMRDSHAWPEVYFPGIGWVEFEPTVSQPAVSYLSGEESDSASSSGGGAIPTPLIPGEYYDRNRPGPDEQLQDLRASRNRLLFWSWFLGVLAALGLSWLFYWRLRIAFKEQPFPVWMETRLRVRGWSVPRWLTLWAQYVLLSTVERLFVNVIFMLKLVGQGKNVGLTPAEKVASLLKVVPIIRLPAEILLDQYQRSIYGPYPCDVKLAREAVTAMWRGVLATWIRRLIGLPSGASSDEVEA